MVFRNAGLLNISSPESGSGYALSSHPKKVRNHD